MAITLDQAPRPTTVQYASFWQRLLAAVLDFVFTLPVFFAVSYFTTWSPNFNGYLGTVLVLMAYRPVMEALFGATLGKMVCKLVVRQAEGGKIGWQEAVFRYIPWLIPSMIGIYFTSQLFALPGYYEVDGFVEMSLFMQENLGEISTLSTVSNLSQFIPLVSALFIFGSPINQALHDQLAQTVVVVK